MKASKLINKSRFTFVIPVVILIAVFFIGYYFYYIPTNKADVQKNGFLILQNIQKSIVKKNLDLQNLYESYFNESSDSLVSLQSVLTKNNIPGIVHGLSDSLTNQNGVDTTKDYVSPRAVGRSFLTTGIQGDNLVYSLKRSHQVSRIFLPASNVLSPVLESQKNELFESYLIIDKKNGIIYKDSALGIVSDISIDSLLPSNTAAYASVKDIKQQDVDYKMFSYPFQFANDDMVLCGFVSTKEYNTRLHEIPVSFVYTIVIAFLLLLIFLPIIKFYLIGDDETIKVVDITLSAVSFIVGPALFTLILIQVLLLWAADMRAKSNLDSLSSQIERSFTRDILKAYRQLDILDSLNFAECWTANHFQEGDAPADVSNQVFNYFRLHQNEPEVDYNFNQIFWISPSGRQKIKGQVGSDQLLFNDVSTRRYFSVFKDSRGYVLPGTKDEFFGFEPVNSWTDGLFRMIISKRSRIKNGVIVAVSTQMPSVMQTILPPGFGFCIIDESGNVQFHSDMNRNLQENIIDKMSPSRSIKEAISSRQGAYLNDIKFYGKTNAANIVPISKIPFFLITFYDKGYIVPIAMRIFTFALLFCLLSFLIYFLIWVALFRKSSYVNPVVYSPMVFFKWAIPKIEAAQFYITGRNFLTGYILFVLLVTGISVPLGISNYVILLIVLVTPVNVITGLFVISYSSIKSASKRHNEKVVNLRKKALKAIIIQLLSSLIVYCYSTYSGYTLELFFLIFQGLFNIALWVYYFSPGKESLALHQEEKYVSQYARLATAIILCLASLPAGLYTWYAHNQEITQSVKKGQLFLAESLQNRRHSILKFIKGQDSLRPPGNYFDQLQYQSGIYTIYHDSINWKTESVFATPTHSYEQFYFAIADDIGNNYYDPLLYPALKDSAADQAWQWSSRGNNLFFQYNLAGNFSAGNNTKRAVQPLNITSVLPPRFMFVGVSLKGLVLLLSVLIFIQGMFSLLRALADRIFLKKYIATVSRNQYRESTISQLVTKLNNTDNKLDPRVIIDSNVFAEEYNHFIPAGSKEAINTQEREIIDIIQKMQHFYNFVWNQCTQKEKYILFDFAKNNLINFKNVGPIYSIFRKGVFIINDSEVKLFSVSFRAWVLEKKNTSEIYNMQKHFQQNSSWQSFRLPVLVIVLGIALFVFFTQEETFQKLTAVVAGISSVLSLLLKFFVDGSAAGASKK